MKHVLQSLFDPQTIQAAKLQKILSIDPRMQKSLSVSHTWWNGMSLCIFKLPPNGLDLSSGEV